MKENKNGEEKKEQPAAENKTEQPATEKKEKAAGKNKSGQTSKTERSLTKQDKVIVAVTCAIIAIFAGLCVLFVSMGTPAAPAVFLALSAACFLSGIAAAILSRRYKFLRFALGMLFVVLSMQIAFNCAYRTDFDSGEQLQWYALMVRVVSSTFQMFTLDADYVTMISLAWQAFSEAGAVAFIALFCTMSIVAPATGGFVIFSLLSRIFPRLQLWAHNFRRTKYIFSELNEYSIATAESIDRERRAGRVASGLGREEWKSLKNSVIIFTDAYIGDGSDMSNELLARAKNIGAICLKDDITELNLRWWFRSARVKKAVYFLMDKQEENNLQDATAILSNDGTVNRWAKCGRGLFGLINNPQRANKLDIFVFTRSAAAYGTISNAYDELINSNENNMMYSTLKSVYALLSQNTMPEAKTMKELCGYGGKLRDVADRIKHSDGNMKEAAEYVQKRMHRLEKRCLDINFKTINEYRNLVYHLISGYAPLKRSGMAGGSTYPLYWGRPTWTDGEGHLEYDLRTLKIAVLGGGRIGKEFIKAAYWCGQMMGREEHEKGPDGKYTYSYYNTKLKIVVLGEKAKSFTRHELEFDMPEAFDEAYKDYCDFVFEDAVFGTAEFEKDFTEFCSDVDYVLVAFGDDELNFRAASWVKTELDRIHMFAGREIPINMVIENSELCEAINKKSSDGKKDGERKCILNAFGAVSYRYDIKNVKVPRAMRLAYIVNTAHGEKLDEKQFYMDEYNSGSSMASALHLPYKLVGMGKLYAKKYFSDESCKQIDDSGYDDALKTEVYWIEHRRWCAYMRSEGYRCPTAHEFFNMAFDKDGNYQNGKQKDNNLRLHACLVESKKSFGTSRSMAGELIKKGRECPEDMSLAEWMDTCMSSASPAADTYTPDNLDKLFMLTGKNFKDYDVGVVKTLISDLKKESMLKDMSTYFPGDEESSEDKKSSADEKPSADGK